MSYKVGDKINLPKQEQSKTKKYEDTLEDIYNFLKKKKEDTFRLDWLKQVIGIIDEYIEIDREKAVYYCKEKYIPLVEKILEDCNTSNMNDFFNCYKKLYAIAGRRDLECFIDYMEFEKSERVLAKRRRVLAPFVYALNRCVYDTNLRYIIASFPPSFGKSFCANYFTAWLFGQNINNSALRISYSEELVLGFSRSIKDLISSPLYSDIFPQYTLYANKPFVKEKESDWKIKNSTVLTSHYSRTRDGAITGVRAKKLIFDDMTKGAEEATNANLHRNYYNKWKTEWFPRKDGKFPTYIFLGTMWSPEDILNRVKEDRERVSNFIPSDKYPYLYESEDGSTIVIKVPLLDENDESTCEEIYTTEEAREIRDTTDEYLFSCVYQQEPIAPTGLEFAYELLNTYDELPKTENGDIDCEEYCFGALDPSRRGKDNVAMPIFKKGNDGKYYFIDCIFKREAISELYDDIVDKIIEHKVIDFVIENNTDTSLKELLDRKLKDKGFDYCIIREKYNVKNKEQRIKDMRGHIKNNIYFKSKDKLRPKTDYFNFMKDFVTYSFDYPAKHDDAPDSLALFTAETIIGKGILPKPIGIDRKTLGI